LPEEELSSFTLVLQLLKENDHPFLGIKDTARRAAGLASSAAHLGSDRAETYI
jgi:hypothetical protein